VKDKLSYPFEKVKCLRLTFVYISNSKRWKINCCSYFVYLKGERWTFEYILRIKRQQVIFSQPKVDKTVILEKGWTFIQLSSFTKDYQKMIFRAVFIFCVYNLDVLAVYLDCVCIYTFSHVIYYPPSGHCLCTDMFY
jgi:hypothetical protein